MIGEIYSSLILTLLLIPLEVKITDRIRASKNTINRSIRTLITAHPLHIYSKYPTKYIGEI